jgi:hypothetical protein
MSNRVDVTIENRRGVFVLRPESPTGRHWLRAQEFGRWEADSLLVARGPDGTSLVVAMIDAGLEVGVAPLYYVQRGRVTPDGESIN